MVDGWRKKGPRESGNGGRARSAARGQRGRQLRQQRLQHEWLISKNRQSERLGHQPPITDGILLCFEVSPPELSPPFVGEGTKAPESFEELVEDGRMEEMVENGGGELDNNDGEERLEDDRDEVNATCRRCSGPWPTIRAAVALKFDFWAKSATILGLRCRNHTL